MKMDKPNQLSICPLQCPGLDSNQHADESTTTSKWLVYQFQHLGCRSREVRNKETNIGEILSAFRSFGHPVFPTCLRQAGFLKRKITNYLFKTIRNVVPFPNSDCFTNNCPLWYWSIIRLDKLNPRPHPLFLVVNPGLNTFVIFCRAIPLPGNRLLLMYLIPVKE